MLLKQRFPFFFQKKKKQFAYFCVEFFSDLCFPNFFLCDISRTVEKVFELTNILANKFLTAFVIFDIVKIKRLSFFFCTFANTFSLSLKFSRISFPTLTQQSTVCDRNEKKTSLSGTSKSPPKPRSVVSFCHPQRNALVSLI